MSGQNCVNTSLEIMFVCDSIISLFRPFRRSTFRTRLGSRHYPYYRQFCEIRYAIRVQVKTWHILKHFYFF